MKKLQIGLAAAALGAAFSATSVMQSNAAPIFVPKTVTAQSDLIEVRDGRRWRHGRHNHSWFPAGAFIAGALIGGAIANSNGYYGNNYYGHGYYGGSYYPGGYYPRRVYYPRRAYYPPHGSYRQGYADGYRAGYNDGTFGIPCNHRMQDAGRC